jgi:hypothetical protein
MNTRPLVEQESRNLAALNQAGIDSVLLFVTETGLEKAILDATDPLRKLFREGKIHDYSKQPKGPEGKVVVETMILTKDGLKLVGTSLYRPLTKNGDPRLWFSRFKEYAGPGDVFAIFVHNEQIHAINISQSTLARCIDAGVETSETIFLSQIALTRSAPSRELLRLLREIAQSGPIPASCDGPTAVGRSVETALGIQINSSRSPDFNGIEIKSGRTASIGRRENRVTLFACVPDWEISAFKSSRAILEEFGYKRDEDFKLYCTVKTSSANSQGLQLEVSEAEWFLREFCVRRSVKDVCIWRLDRLHERLEQKHRETFWIKAKAIGRGRAEMFQLESVIHTRRPSVNQFDRLLSDGNVTLDHLIKRAANGRTSEKGPLFKIERPKISELFLGEPIEYSLSTSDAIGLLG